jgi:integrase
MLKLYVSSDGKNFQETSGLLLGPNVKPVFKTLLTDAIVKYLKICTAAKSKKADQNERKYFDDLLLYCISFGVAYVDELRLEHFQSIESDLLKEVKYASVVRRFSCYRDFLTKCMDWEYIQIHPMAKLKKRKMERNPHKKWSREEFYKFLQTTDGDWRNICLFLWYTGCRAGEALTLQWIDVDYDARKLIFKSGKNGDITREFYLMDYTGDLLHSINLKGAHVLAVNGRQITTDNLYQYIKHRLKKLGLGHLTTHGIRHSFAGRAQAAGIPISEIQEFLGHKKIETTLMYINPTEKELRSSLSKVAI